MEINDSVREGGVIVETNGNEYPRLNILLRFMRKDIGRLNLIVVSCGESFVTTNEWSCTASQAHTRATVLFSRLKKSTTEIGNII